MTVDKRLEELLDFVITQGGSDLHLFAGGSPMLRVSGALIPMSKYPVLSASETEAMFKSIVEPERWDSFKNNQTIDLSYSHKEGERFPGKWVSRTRSNDYCISTHTFCDKDFHRLESPFSA